MHDANHDGVFDARDADFARVRLWQDRNQDGLSQSDELSTLPAKGIAAVSLTPSSTAVDLGNGNSIAGSAAVTRVDGGTAGVGAMHLAAGNLNLVDNPFHRKFADEIPLTDAARRLPDMGGSGWVRDLREAMSLSTPQSQALQAAVERFSAGATQAAQMAEVDSLLQAWADTTGRRGEPTAARPISTTREPSASGAAMAHITLAEPGAAVHGPFSRVARFDFPSDAYYTPGTTPYSGKRLNDAGAEVMRRMTVLEVFNGSRFLDFTREVGVAPAVRHSDAPSSVGAASAVHRPNLRLRVALTEDQISFINAAYHALRESVYESLAVQTRLQPYLDAIGLVMEGDRARLDFAPMEAAIAARSVTEPYDAVADLVDLRRFESPALTTLGWNADASLANLLASIPRTPDIDALLAADPWGRPTEVPSGLAVPTTDLERASHVDRYWSAATDPEWSVTPAPWHAPSPSSPIDASVERLIHAMAGFAPLSAAIVAAPRDTRAAPMPMLAPALP